MVQGGWRRRQVLLAGGAATLAGTTLAGTGPARAEALDRPARIVTNFPPGSSIDTVARLYAERLRGVYAPQVVVDNRPGAAGRLAIDVAKTATPDGTTLLLTPESMMVVYPWVYPRTLRYDPQKDFIPVTGVSSFGFVWMVDANHPAKTFPDFVAWARTQGEVPYATPAAGSTPHFISVQLAKSLGLNLVHVPYRDMTNAFADLNGGRIAAYVSTVGTTAEFHRSGRMRLLALTMPERAAALPDVPTFRELGHGDMTIDEWFGVFLPAGTPPALVTALNAAFQQAAQDPALRAAMLRMEQNPVRTTPAEFATRLASERVRWEPIVRASGYTVEE